jgi:hypothetical protein
MRGGDETTEIYYESNKKYNTLLIILILLVTVLIAGFIIFYALKWTKIPQQKCPICPICPKCPITPRCPICPTCPTCPVCSICSTDKDFVFIDHNVSTTDTTSTSTPTSTPTSTSTPTPTPTPTPMPPPTVSTGTSELPQSACNNFSVLRNKKFNLGSVSGTHTVSNITDCKTKCLENNCDYASFDSNTTNNNCSLYKLTYDPNNNLNIKISDNKTGCPQWKTLNAKSENIYGFTNQYITDCKGYCESNPSCIAYSTSNGNCVIKNINDKPGISEIIPLY